MAEEEKEITCSRCAAVWQKCGTTNCWSNDPASAPPRPANCPSALHPEVISAAFQGYREDTEDARIAAVAAKVEGMCYQPVPGSDAVNARWTRVEDTVAFAKLMGYKKIGIATCIGLLEESDRLSVILKAQGLEPHSVCCKAGSIDKNKLGLSEEDKVRPGTFEPACNPVAQAEICNRLHTDLNIIMGLCIGHDILFTRHAKAPTTTLVVKDRVTGHDPVKVLHGQNFYYARLRKQPVLKDE